MEVRKNLTAAGCPGGRRRGGRSRDDLPQVVVGMAVTRDGIPVRVWSWPGNTADSALIRQVRDDMRDWTLSRIIWVADRGFSSEATAAPMPGRRRLHHRREAALGLAGGQAALSRQGRYTASRTTCGSRR